MNHLYQLLNSQYFLFSHAKKSALFLGGLTGMVLLLNLPSFGHTTSWEWTLLQTRDNVSFYYSIGSCHGSGKHLLLKVDNQNSSAVGVSWTIELSENTKKLHFPGLPSELAAGESKTITCERPDPLALPMPITDDFVSPLVRIGPHVEKMPQ